MNSSDTLMSVLFTVFSTSLVGVLGWIAISINKMSELLAVVVFRVDNHENRITGLEKQKDLGSHFNESC